MSEALVGSAVAPVYGSPDHRAELVSEALLGHVLETGEERGAFVRVRCADDCRGWVHAGHLLRGAPTVVPEWEDEAHATSLGAVLAAANHRLLLPLGARVVLAGDGSVRLPDGRIAQVASGRVAPESDLREEARQLGAAEWAAVFFAGAPYRWGGVTPWGVDCSGLVQAVHRVRGVRLPRDAAEQARSGEAVETGGPLHPFLPGDLLFFSDEPSGRITHVAIADGVGYVVHASAATGGVCRSPLAGGSAEAVRLRETFRLARRPEHHPEEAAPRGRTG